MTNPSSAFLDCLGADGPSADRAGNMDLYGWLIGSWALDVTRFLPDGSRAGGPASGTSAGCWRAAPSRTCGWCRRAGPSAGDAAANIDVYGTTLRVYDPRIDAWQIQWTDPVTQTYLSMIGRSEGSDIVQLGKSPDGNLIRWSFSQITADRFVWRGEVSVDGGATWRLDVEFLARRM